MSANAVEMESVLVQKEIDEGLMEGDLPGTNSEDMYDSPKETASAIPDVAD
ncbi:unnamed protein product, partial [Allacma fusca]